METACERFFWLLIFGYDPHSDRTQNITGNRSGHRKIDVLQKNCLSNYELVACARSSLLCLLCVGTLLFSVVYLFRLSRLSRRRSREHHALPSGRYHRILLFYAVFVHCMLGSVEWAFGWTTQSQLACAYLCSFELLLICHFYVTRTLRLVHWRGEDTAGRLSVMALTLLFLYFTFFVLLAAVYAVDPWLDCYANYWLWLSGGQLLTTQLMVVTSAVLCRKINSVSAEAAIKTAQKRDLVCLLFSFELAAVLSFAYHAVIFLMVDEESSCSGLFKHRQQFYSTVMLLYQLITYLMPLWAILWVFRVPSATEMLMDNPYNSQNSLLSGRSEASVVVVRPEERARVGVGWRRRYRPLGAQNLLIEPNSALAQRSLFISRSLGRQQSNNGGGGTPSFVKRSKSGAQIRVNLSRSRSAPEVVVCASSSASTQPSNVVQQSSVVQAPSYSNPLAPITEETASESGSWNAAD